MAIVMTNLADGVLPASIGLSGELVIPTPTPSDTNNISLVGDVQGNGALTIQTAIAPGVVTYEKLQNESATTLLGNPTGSSAAPSEISIGSGLVFSSNSLNTAVSVGGNVNKFRNGTMDVWQRGTGTTTITTAGGYYADGWIITPTGASCTAIQAANNRSGANTLFGLQITGAASVTDIKMTQRIESYIAAALSSNVVTVQAQIFNNTGVSITPTLTTQTAGTTDVWTSPVTDLAATNLQACANGVWTQVSYTLAVSSNAKVGYAFIFDFGNNFSSTGKFVIVAELDVRVSPGIALGLNSSPPPPEMRQVEYELALCQRYYAKTFPQATVPGHGRGNSGCVAAQTGSFSGGNALILVWTVPQTMRTGPSCVGFNPSAAGVPGCIGDFFGASASNGSYTVIASDARVIVSSGAVIAFTPALHITATAEL